ncbi:MAG: hypothetical protein QM820_34510 [Minicystis sp.]
MVVKKVAAVIRSIPLPRQVRERTRQERAAQAITDGGHLALPRGLLDRVERGQRPLGEVILEALLRELLVRVHPGDDEHREALGDGPAHEGVLGAEIDDVILVDPRRHDEQRSLVDLLGRRRELDELHQIGLEDDLARRGGDVAAQLEGLHVLHANPQVALPGLEIFEQVGEALHQVLAAALQRGLEHRGVERDHVGRRHRVDELAGVEVDALRRLGIEALHVGHGLLEGARREQVRLLDEIEDGALGPLLVLEAAVLGRGLDDGLDLGAEHAAGGALPEREVVLPEAHLDLDHLLRARHHLLRQLEEGLGDHAAPLRGRRRDFALGLAAEEIGDQLAAGLGDAREALGYDLAIGELEGGLLLVAHGQRRVSAIRAGLVDGRPTGAAVMMRAHVRTPRKAPAPPRRHDGGRRDRRGLSRARR